MTRKTPAASLVVLGWLAAGCTITTPDGARLRAGQPAFAEYVERVFRLQNAVISELAFALDEAPLESARYLALEAAEQTVLDACDGLNELATARQRGDERRGPGGLKAARSAPECERAALAARRSLQPPAL